MSADHHRSPQLRRAIELARLLSQHAMTLEQLAEALGVGQRTVRRDIYALQAEGIDILDVLSESSTERDDRDELPLAARLRGGRPTMLRMDIRSWTGTLYRPTA